MTDHSNRREARIETTHTDETTARRLAQALRPDNTAEMETMTDGCQVVTTIRREDTGGVHATIDDYVVNLTVGARVLSGGRSASDTAEHANRATETHEHDTTGDTNE